MQNNLEGIPFDEVRDSKGTSYADFRKTLHPGYSTIFFDIAKGYFFLLLVTGSTIFLTDPFRSSWWIIVPVSGILIGYIAAYHFLFIHEAGHYNIHPSKKINDRLATIFLCLPTGLTINTYRKI